MNKIKAVVIDDEEFNRSLIIDLITELNPHFEILGQAGSVKTAFELIGLIKPEVVFLDIKMPDGNGFELLNMFEEITFEVVFISGFDAYALKAFEFNALGYILKPIEPEKLAGNLQKVQELIEKRSFSVDTLKSIVQSYDLKQMIISKIPLHTGKKVRLLNFSEILYIKSADGCTLFKTSSGEVHLSSKQLSDFEFIVDLHPCMVRANKSTYINLEFIENYSKGLTCLLTMKDNSTIEISRRKKKEVLHLLTGKKEK